MLHNVTCITVYIVHDVMDGCIVYVNDNDYYLDYYSIIIHLM
ncbi:hypothetical protein VPHK406_0135 [Vibrio phage K406]